MTNEPRTEGADRRMGIVLAILVALTVLFLGLSVLHKRPMDAFELRASSFAGFSPRLEGWSLEKLPVGSDPVEPNILCYSVTPRGATILDSGRRAGMTLRLVHGYNMRDCMRIKGYLVEEMQRRSETGDHRPQTMDRRPRTTDAGLHATVTANKARSTKHEAPMTNDQAPSTPSPFPGQMWRMVSPAGVTSLWATVMLRADTFEATDRDVCSMPFPRVGIPDDPDWSPGGLTLDGLRHPVANARRVVRAKWNASRSDLLTFLGFRRPAWVQAEWLTLVVAGEAGIGSGGDITAASLLAVESEFVRELRDWRRGGKRP
jgi:hypothetical protein